MPKTRKYYEELACPLGMLENDDVRALRDAFHKGEPIELWTAQDGWKVTTIHPHYWNLDIPRRLKELPVIKPSVDWSQVPDCWNWMATDKDGGTFFFRTEPSIVGMYWKGSEHANIVVHMMHTSFVPGTCDWKDSLVQRPQV